MADDKVSGTPVEDDGAAAAAASGTPPPDGADAKISDDAQAELERLKQELEQTKQLNLTYKQKVERLNELERAGAQVGAAPTSPTPTPNVDPDVQMLERLVSEYQQFPTEQGRFLVSELYQRIQAKQQAAAFQQWTASNEAQIEVASDDEDTKSLAKELLRSGRYAGAEEALWAARGRRGDKRLAAEQERARRDDLARARANALPSTTAGGDAEPAPAKKKMTGRQYLEFLDRNPGTDAARKLIADVDNQRVIVDWSQT